ncbi:MULTISPECIES: hypothetical protein [unclassified Bacillus (in: firmicutes)]|uniref:hypothetical protein n=1 Tax=unclassified Bacillus (in: firmicutes) TaxID=185979 RepID=UPI0003FE2E7A|nr:MULTISPECIES: hypothetical protein [unclassified Bacillus (in: firmicutes)]WFA06558.1 hypothetical protein P3X63_07200 [Bacillus sp. HSf4]
MCRLCEGRKTVHRQIGSATMFAACPNCRDKRGDLTETINKLEALMLKMKARVKQSA